MLGFSMSLIPFTIDPYLPAFPAIGEFFGVANGTIQASLSGVTIGLAFGQLFAGPLSDAFGRRPLLLLATLGFAISALALFFSPNLTFFIAVRFAMGFFAASADVVARAIVRDLYHGQPMLKMLTKIFMVQSLSPIIGPIVGSQLVGVGPWQLIFLTFGLFGLALGIFSLFFMHETLPVAQRRSPSLTGMLRGFQSVLKDRIYVGLLIVSALQISALFGYLNVVPYLYQDHFGLSAPDFGVWFAVNSIGLWLGVQFGGLMAKYFRAQWLMVVFIMLAMLAGLSLMITAGTTLIAAEIGFFAVIFLFGAPATIIPTIALLKHGSEAGTASSLMGTLNFVSTSVAALVYSQLSTTSTDDVGLWIFTLFTISLLVIVFVVRPWTIPDLREARPDHD
jgi:DHA1 family bicyclomycin/chloramphenicol resistance-like MFS transporter